MVSEDKMTIIPRKGEYCLMDSTVGDFVHSTVFQLPTAYGKGVLVTPTVHGNLLTGPTATDIDDKEGVNTTAEGMNELLKKAELSTPNLPRREIITSFSGLRAHRPEHDFVIEEVDGAPGFVDVAGMESPGLSSAPAVGQYVAEIVTEGEIVNAIHRTLGATTVDGIKRRTSAGMGRCQSGFCNPRVVEILARELGVDEEQITKKGPGSQFLEGYDKEGIRA